MLLKQKRLTKQLSFVSRWVLRCHACYTVTAEIGRIFCPKCGNGGTLRKVAVTVGENGIVLAARRPRITLRGTKVSIQNLIWFLAKVYGCYSWLCTLLYFGYSIPGFFHVTKFSLQNLYPDLLQKRLFYLFRYSPLPMSIYES